MTSRKKVLLQAVFMTLVSGPAFAAQVPYASFTPAGGVSNLTTLTPEGTGCLANCEDFAPVYGGHGFTFGAANDVTFAWSGSVFTDSTDYTGPDGASNATISSPTIFLGYSWTIHDVQIFGPGTYVFDAAAGGDANDFETGVLSMTIGPGQLGVHMLMDWNETKNMDILNVWNIGSVFSDCGSSGYYESAMNCLWTWNPNPAGNNAGTVFLFSSTDNDGDGTLGIPTAAGGPFHGTEQGGFNFNFNMHGSMTVVPLPAAVWLFGSGLLALAAAARRRKNGSGR